MFAVIKTGGKQYKVSEGDRVQVEKLDAKEGDVVEIRDVLLLSDGKKTTVGAPTIDGAAVSAKVDSHGRGAKIKVVKFKRRKNYLRQMGHRQAYTQLSIVKISPGKSVEKKSAEKKSTEKKSAEKVKEE